MRISEKKLVHLVEHENPSDNTIVIMNESDGNEVELNREEFMKVLALVNFSFNIKD